MYTQNTPVHVKLWHREFWQLAFANLLLTMSVYMFIPVLPLWLLRQSTPLASAAVMGAYAVGLYLLGGCCSYLVQRYRRNRVCQWAIVAMMASLAAMYLLEHGGWPHAFPCFSAAHEALLPTRPMLILRLLVGASFGLAQMVLMSTLIIDTSESFQRTEANHSAAWFGRFALSTGPLVALVVNRFWGLDGVLAASFACCLLAVVCIEVINFPFKAPEDRLCRFTLDRFFLPHGFWLFLNQLLVTLVLGMVLTTQREPLYYVMLMAGFLLALLSQRFVFANAELKSEIISGQLLMGAAILMLMSTNRVAVSYLSPVLMGQGVGIIGARFLLFFIKLSRHCQRGTSQSTYFLSWETGLSIGIFLGIGFFSDSCRTLFYVALAVLAASLLMYQVFTHSWYMRNKNR